VAVLVGVAVAVAVGNGVALGAGVAVGVAAGAQAARRRTTNKIGLNGRACVRFIGFSPEKCKAHWQCSITTETRLTFTAKARRTQRREAVCRRQAAGGLLPTATCVSAVSYRC